MCDVTVGKLLKHNGDGYGFKITFNTEKDAVGMDEFLAVARACGVVKDE